MTNPESQPHPKQLPKGWYSRGVLPHFDSNEKIQHVTFHLADSIPQSGMPSINEQIRNLASKEQEIERRKRLEALMDSGCGSCILKKPEFAEIIQSSLLHFDGTRYRIYCWVVMPNHVHVLFQTIDNWSMQTIVASWKSYTANQIYTRMGMNEKTDSKFWHPDYWDRYIRDERHFNTAVSYIHNNPVKAGLVARAEDWKWSSANLDHRREILGDELRGE